MTTWQNNYLTFKTNSALDSLSANAAREKSFQSFLTSGLPDKKAEAWKFTSLNKFSEVNWALAEDSDSELSHDELKRLSIHLSNDFINIVLVNGKLNKTLSDDVFEFIEIVEASTEDFLVKSDHVDTKIIALAQSFLSHKVVIKIKKNQMCEKPILIVTTQKSKNAVFASEKIEVIAEENSHAVVLVHGCSLDEKAYSKNLSIDFTLMKNANVKFVHLQNENQQSFLFSQVEAKLSQGSQWNSLILSLGNQIARSYFNAQFQQQFAFAGVYGLLALDQQQHNDHYTSIQHSIGENQSIQHYKSILSGQAESIFRGRIRIEPNAQKAQSEQLHNNLLLTKTSTAHSIPQLEIFADDVKAGHGSTLGQLSKEEIFYFLSRGISQNEAIKMLSYGYAQELLFKIENKFTQHYCKNILNIKLEKMIQGFEL